MTATVGCLSWLSPDTELWCIRDRGRGRIRRRPARFIDSETSEGATVRQEPTHIPTVGQGGRSSEIPVTRAPEIPITDPIPTAPSRSVDLSRIPLLAKSVKDRVALFHGGPDPWLARSWLENMTDTFAYISCTETERVELAVYHLRDQAVTWWKTQRMVFGQRDLSWISFREAFERQYFPATFCQERRQEFLSLKQGDRSVTEYNTEFSRLAEFCSHLVVQDSDRMFQFTQGLAPYIRLKMAGLSVSTYREALEKALSIESIQRQVNRERDAEKPKNPSTQTSGQKRPAQGAGTRGSSRQQKGKRPAGSESGLQQREFMEKRCYRCGSSGHQISDCPSDQSVCYYCKQPGHMIGDCPRRAQLEISDTSSSRGRSTQSRSQRVPAKHRAPKQQRSSSSSGQMYQIQGKDYIVVPAPPQPEICYAAIPVQQQPPAALTTYSAPHYVQQTTSIPQSQFQPEQRQTGFHSTTQPASTEVGRVYAITREEAQRADGSVIRGMVSVYNIFADTLIDTGSSHSFMSRIFLRKIGRISMVRPSSLAVSLPSGEVLTTNQQIRGCPLDFDGHLLTVDLQVLDMMEFDIILGMDWLATYHATVDCRARVVTFRPADQPSWEFVDDVRRWVPRVSSVYEDSRGRQSFWPF
ncbi:uncharacterized protein LOC141815105 [Curcuma longa]|uniref:uncharacterized protein LOC141815105 n=1 Tax=Curcuma longa TaxID=136217 RepID=UPI003D9DC38A